MQRKSIELIKNLLIAMLLCSAVYLLALANTSTGITKAFQAIFTDHKATQESGTSVSTSAASGPVKMAVTNEMGRLGVMYDSAALDDLYTSLGSLLGEALGTLSPVEEISLNELEEALTQYGVYFEYPAEIPLDALAEWLGTSLPVGSGSASVLYICRQQQNTMLYYLEGERVYRGQVAVDIDSFNTDIEAYRPNDAYFAYEMVDSHPQLENIHPITLITAGGVALPVVISDAAPVDARTAVVSAFGFNPYTDVSYTDSLGVETFSGSTSQLVINPSGLVSFRNRSGEQYRYLVQSSTTTPTTAEIIETVRALLSDMEIGGDAALMLVGYEADETGYDISFDYFISGARVSARGAPAVTARIEQGILISMDVSMKYYSLSTKKEGLMPELQAAVVVSGRLVAEYSDNGQEQLKVGWR